MAAHGASSSSPNVGTSRQLPYWSSGGIGQRRVGCGLFASMARISDADRALGWQHMDVVSSPNVGSYNNYPHWSSGGIGQRCVGCGRLLVTAQRTRR